jgi:hypothetical protein
VLNAVQVRFLESLFFGRDGHLRLFSTELQLHKPGQNSHRKLVLLGNEAAMGRAASQIIVNLWEDANTDGADDMEVWKYETAVRP